MKRPYDISIAVHFRKLLPFLLRGNCVIFSKQADKYKGIIPLAQIIWDLHIGKNELISFKIAVCEAAELYGFPRSTAAVYVLNNLREYNKKGQLQKELSALHLQKYALDQACSSQSQSLINLAKLKSYGLTEDRILELNSFLENNGINDMKSNYSIQRDSISNLQQGRVILLH
jgi:hypothetical protein